MNAKIVMVSLIAILTIVMLGAITSAAPLQISNQYVEVDRTPATGNNAVTAGVTMPIDVWFTANENASEVQVSAWVQGYRDEKAQENFDQANYWQTHADALVARVLAIEANALIK